MSAIGDTELAVPRSGLLGGIVVAGVNFVVLSLGERVQVSNT